MSKVDGRGKWTVPQPLEEPFGGKGNDDGAAFVSADGVDKSVPNARDEKHGADHSGPDAKNICVKDRKIGPEELPEH